MLLMIISKNIIIIEEDKELLNIKKIQKLMLYIHIELITKLGH